MPLRGVCTTSFSRQDQKTFFRSTGEDRKKLFREWPTASLDRKKKLSKAWVTEPGAAVFGTADNLLLWEERNMKNYRTVLADNKAMGALLETLCEKEEFAAQQAQSYRDRAKEAIENGDGDETYYTDQANEYEAMAAAFERLIAKLGK